MNKTILTTLTVLLSTFMLFAQSEQKITTPKFDDAYSQSVKKLENGRTDIDYKTFREDFLKSKQFSVAAKLSSHFHSLQREMYSMMHRSSYDSIIGVTKQMLSIDYTSMIAHKILSQTYKILGDTANARKYKNIEFGLLYSIIRNGDGKTCETGWPVIQVPEEYFILNMLGAKLVRQSVDNTNGTCDKMEVTVDGKNKTYYFDISKVMEKYER